MGYKYEAVAVDLKHRLTWKEWGVGEQLPGVHDLAAHYEEDLATAREALTSAERRLAALTEIE